MSKHIKKPVKSLWTPEGEKPIHLEEQSETVGRLPKVLIGIPSRGTWPAIFEKHIVDALAGLNEVFEATKYPTEWYITDDARNKVACKALEDNYDYVFFMDVDHVFERYALARLLYDISQIESEEPCIIGGIYCSRAGGHRWHVYKGKVKQKWQSVKFQLGSGVHEVDVIGTGCMLIETEVFRRMKLPFFEYKYINIKQEEYKYERMSEDFVFCEKAKDAGVRIFADTEVKCGHLHSVQIWPTTNGGYDVLTYSGELYQ